MLYFGWQTNVVAYFQVNNFIKIMTSRDRAPSHLAPDEEQAGEETTKAKVATEV